MPKTATIQLPDEFVFKCEDSDVSPQQVLEAFIRDLCALDGSHGSDERDLAQGWFERCGYGWRDR